MKVKLIKTRTYTTHINYILWARRKSGFQKCAHHINKLIKIDFTVNRYRHHSYFLASISIHIGAENSWMCMKVPGPVLRGAPCLMKASLISVQSKAPVRTGHRLASLVDGHVCGYCCCARTTCHSFFVVVFVPCYVEITLKKSCWVEFCFVIIVVFLMPGTNSKGAVLTREMLVKFWATSRAQVNPRVTLVDASSQSGTLHWGLLCLIAQAAVTITIIWNLRPIFCYFLFFLNKKNHSKKNVPKIIIIHVIITNHQLDIIDSDIQ